LRTLIDQEPCYWILSEESNESKLK
jgi:hypothetical protein